MQAEGELRSNLEESDRVRDLQDKVADLKAEVRKLSLSSSSHLSETLTNYLCNTKNSLIHQN